MASRPLLAAALAAIGLTACNDQNRGPTGHAVSGLCLPFTGQAANGSAAAVAPPSDGAGVLDDCLHRWGYALAASTDDADQVANAAVAACSTALSRWNQHAMLPAGAPGTETTSAVEAPSLITGETITPVAGRYAYAQGRALFYVVQARAGRCAPPPMNRGAPATAPAAP